MPSLAAGDYSDAQYSFFSTDYINGLLDRGLEIYRGITEVEIQRDQLRNGSQVPGTVGVTGQPVPSAPPSSAFEINAKTIGIAVAVVLGAVLVKKAL